MAATCKSAPAAMVDGQFCAPHQTTFTLFKSHSWKGSEFEVTSSADGGAAVMQVETAHIGYLNLRSLRLLDTVSRRPLIALEEFATGGWRRWEGFSGDSTNGSDRLFVATRTGYSEGRLTVHVFLGANSSGKGTPDYVVSGWYGHGQPRGRGTMTVSRGTGDGGDDKDIAEIGRRRSTVDAHDPVGENVYTVAIKPGVDQALVFALTVIVDQMYDGDYCACCCQHKCLRKRGVHRH